jgi:hypothetical protein
MRRLEMPVRVGIVDSGLDSGTCPGLVAARNLASESGGDAVLDRLGHGSAVSALISGPGVEICAARVFDRKLTCTPAVAAAAIVWLLDQDVRIINLSFGLRHDRALLREACDRALARGVCLVAASPAQGAAVFPASYPGVLRATGDARCAAGEISWLDSPQADFGGYAGDVDKGPAGASIGCASVTGALAALAAQHPDWNSQKLLRELKSTAHYRGPEQRSAAASQTVPGGQ